MSGRAQTLVFVTLAERPSGYSQFQCGSRRQLSHGGHMMQFQGDSLGFKESLRTQDMATPWPGAENGSCSFPGI